MLNPYEITAIIKHNNGTVEKVTIPFKGYGYNHVLAHLDDLLIDYVHEEIQATEVDIKIKFKTNEI